MWGPFVDLWPDSAGWERMVYAEGGLAAMSARVRRRIRILEEG